MKAIRPSDDCDAQRPPPPRGRTPGRKGRTRQSVSLTPRQPNTRKVVPGAGAAGMTGEPLARAIDDTAALLMDISELIRDRDPTGRLGSGRTTPWP